MKTKKLTLGREIKPRAGKNYDDLWDTNGRFSKKLDEFCKDNNLVWKTRNNGKDGVWITGEMDKELEYLVKNLLNNDLEGVITKNAYGLAYKRIVLDSVVKEGKVKDTKVIKEGKVVYHKVKDYELKGWQKYEQLMEEVGEKKLLVAIAQWLPDQKLEEIMDDLANEFDIEFKNFHDKAMSELDIDLRDDLDWETQHKKFIEELSSYLNNMFGPEGLEIYVDYSDDEITLRCDNYLSEEEHQSLIDTSFGWLRTVLNMEDYDNTYSSNKEEKTFYITIKNPDNW